jgi:heme exporter protein D
MPHLDLGKYAAFIVPAYGITAVVFVGMIAGSLGFARRWRRKAEQFSDKSSDAA